MDAGLGTGQGHGALIPEAQGSGSLALTFGLVDALKSAQPMHSFMEACSTDNSSASQREGSIIAVR